MSKHVNMEILWVQLWTQQKVIFDCIWVFTFVFSFSNWKIWQWRKVGLMRPKHGWLACHPATPHNSAFCPISLPVSWRKTFHVQRNGCFIRPICYSSSTTLTYCCPCACCCLYVCTEKSKPGGVHTRGCVDQISLVIDWVCHWQEIWRSLIILMD